MEVLHGADALAAAERLAGEGLVCVCVDPGSGRQRPPRLVALATAQRAILVDGAAVPQLAGLWARPHAFAAADAKAVHHALLQACGAAPGRWGCARLCALLLAGGRDHDLGLEAQAGRHGVGAPPDPRTGLAAMAAHAVAVAQLVHAQGAALRAAGLQKVSRLEAAAVAPIAEMEAHGMPFDRDAWQRLAGAADREQQALAHQIALALRQRAPSGAAEPPAVTPGCLDQDAPLRALLRAHGLVVPNVRRATLAQLPAPLGAWLSRYRLLRKMATQYGDSFLAHAEGDGRLHATFEQIGASTGRMACRAPNLQAVVKGTEHRGCFCCRPGRRLVIADYSACELRILAEMSGDPTFCAAFAAGADVHAQVATAVFGRPVSRARNAHLRQTAKVISFGLAYGMGAAGLGRALAVELPRARALLEQYFATFPKVRGHLHEAAAAALRRGHAQTLLGRRLYLSGPTFEADPGLAERVAKNMPIQGTNADIIKLALGRLRPALQALGGGAHVVHCVHDEVVVECDETAAPQVVDTVRREMEAAGAVALRRVPLAVDVEVASRWG